MTPAPVPVLLIAVKTVTLVFGGAVTALAVRAWRRSGGRSLGALALGIGLLTVGALFGGTAHLLLGLELATGVLVESLFAAGGFAVLTYSLYADGG